MDGGAGRPPSLSWPDITQRRPRSSWTRARLCPAPPPSGGFPSDAKNTPPGPGRNESLAGDEAKAERQEEEEELAFHRAVIRRRIRSKEAAAAAAAASLLSSYGTPGWQRLPAPAAARLSPHRLMPPSLPSAPGAGRAGTFLPRHPSADEPEGIQDDASPGVPPGNGRVLLLPVLHPGRALNTH
ncbi:uncharacterized protein LOC133370753 isoform X3 [Rhineura floridana]|uniref:uncharacterized protein LOC133370753 isoform X3 n=1 Tax=Rhineura floridana TaxID=261503 RepID=UPI002AC7F267|nr:uncharacterized protein LOC133370753 isoform X3 [Rhineura floridana]